MSTIITKPFAGPHVIGTSQASFRAFQKVHGALEVRPRKIVESALDLQEGIFDESNTPEELRVEFRRALGVSEWGKLLGATRLVGNEPSLGVDIASGALNVAHALEKPDAIMRRVVEDILQSMYGVVPEEQEELREKAQALTNGRETGPDQIALAETKEELCGRMEWLTGETVCHQLNS